MSLTKSRIISRQAPMKGVRAIGIAPYLASAPVVNTVTGVIALPSHISTGTTIARFEVKAVGNNVIETGTFDEATRTNEYLGVNTFFIPGNDVELRNELQGNNGILKTVFIEDYNGKIYCLGAKNGCDIMTIVGGSDTQGFTVTINSKETELMYFLAAAGVTAYNSSLLAV
ncbi:hypothetical protein [Flavobacterium sp.]|uniref:hypothetical protein n=1 Tax=Flavobacterium sp. TaxID=239 RepID=UPI0038FD0868